MSVWALGEQRFRIQAPSGAEVVEGFAEARKRARELAGLASQKRTTVLTQALSCA